MTSEAYCCYRGPFLLHAGSVQHMRRYWAIQGLHAAGGLSGFCRNVHVGLAYELFCVTNTRLAAGFFECIVHGDLRSFLLI